ncbi:amino acid transporter [Arthrobacter sp. MYb227]|uniref:LysE/ArgO family amino acid transporter n=1 Tax=Arthrobacter sp. MYb227 TaxID=1848601 RepID=UPI000CFB6813|nr:LysE/ArgO family amino acid transporter [Arthrobacter sp. MYb227]PQZ90257.1 amino acid transporter [Arthrobacter sp. MYb227]
MTLLPLFTGLATGLSLIVAIGAQNAFVLRQGIRQEHVRAAVLICMTSDIVLIFAGITGLGALLSIAPWFITVARLGGAVFLVAYAIFAARRAANPQSLTHSVDESGSTLKSVVLTTLALTWLNPHVYLDTVVLLGSIAAAQGPNGRWLFGTGAALGSVLWFSSLGFGARHLRGFFANPVSWRILDGVIALVMLLLAIMLVIPLFG